MTGNRGFTLIEMLVAILIFSIIIGAATGVFASAIKLQRYSLTHQQLLDQTSYAMEYMSRAIRMAQKDTTGGCTGTANKNYKSTGNDIKFVTYNNECWEFYVDGGQLKIDKNGTPYELTSGNFNVNSFNVIVPGDESEKQPRVTIFMEIQGEGLNPQPRIKIQTTISQRNLN